MEILRCILCKKLEAEVNLVAFEIVDLKCPNCGADISLETKVCEFCSSHITIRTVNNVFTSVNDKNVDNNSAKTEKQNISAVIQFLKAGLFDRAIAFCESVIQNDFNNSDVHYYAAIALLKGKRPFLASASAIKKAEEYLQTAIAIEPKGIYYYLWAYIRLDHHFRKFYKMSPNYSELYSKAKNVGLSPTDVNDLYSILDVERPSEL